MADKVIDEFEIRDLEDNVHYRISVEACDELGNKSKPGLRIRYSVPGGTYACVIEPYLGEKWIYDARKAGLTEYFIKDRSWTHYDNAWVKNYIVIDGDKLKARVEVKVKSREKPEVREYDLPFSF
ncbi:MAG: hypothetical protein KF696_03185 [Planctomycetes bacterium]|nr:hypothetical protein [Planctomycetota bacterium]MCW8135010.1 hypothetical protein [Planctomycetota bacterium]